MGCRPGFGESSSLLLAKGLPMIAMRDLTSALALHWISRDRSSPEALAARLDLIYNGVQRVPGIDDHWVFTDRVTGSTFLTPVGVACAALHAEANRVRAKYAEVEAAMNR